jgi:hypothetical protein
MFLIFIVRHRSFLRLRFLFQEMRTMHDELVKQKTAFQSRLQGRDDEIDRLRGQAKPIISCILFVD